MAYKKNLIFFSITSFFCMSLLFFSYSTEQTDAKEITPDTRVEMEDVVIVNYTLWVENIREDDQEGTVYVVDPDQPVPNTIIEQYPDIKVPPNVGFREAMLGMVAGGYKQVDIPPSSGKGFINISDPLYGKLLTYQIRLLEILYDASSPPVTLIDLPFFIPLMAIVFSVLAILIFLRIQRYSRVHNILGLKQSCFACKTKIATIKCGNSGCNTPYCKECFLEKGCRLCHSNTMVPIK
ncbi:MAG: hypothetical protein ACFFAU_05295 [Candidatus Hodarchaeota archaeon]